MQRILILLATSTTLLTSIAQAQPNAGSIEEQSQEEPTNAELREGKAVSLTFGASLLLPAAALDLGFFITPRLLAEVSLEAGAAVFSEHSSTGIRLRGFLTDTFNVTVGVGYRQSVQHHIDFFSDEDPQTHYEDIAFDMAIGNRWQWDNFTLGVDWIAFSGPVVTLSAEERAYNSSGFTETTSTTESPQPDVQFGLVKLGLTF